MLEQIVRVSNHLLCAIGGINMRNIYDVLETGVDGVAIASMICGANDPLKASKRLINSIAQRRESKNDS